MQHRRILTYAVLIAVIFLTGCQWISPLVPEEEPEIIGDDPVTELAEKLQLTDEQLQQLEEGTGTMQLTEEQVDILRDSVEQFLDEARETLGETRWQEVKDIFDTLLTEGKADLQGLGRVAEDIYGKLKDPVGSEAVVYTNFGKISEETNSSAAEQSPLSEGSEITTVYTPRGREEGLKDFYSTWVEGDVLGPVAEYIPSANIESGQLGVYSRSMIGVAVAIALQGIRIGIPASKTDVKIEAKIKYHTGTYKYFAALAGTSLVKRDFYGDLLEDVIDPRFDWKIAIQIACTIAAQLRPGTICLDKETIRFMGEIQDYEHLRQVLEDTEEKQITYSANSLTEGTYTFDIGLKAKTSSAVLGSAGAFALGQVTEIKVTQYIPQPVLTVELDGDGSGTVTSDPPGIDCTPNCEDSFDRSTEVTLTASPDGNSVFDGWGGDCSGTDPQTTILMDENKTCTVTFKVEEKEPQLLGEIKLKGEHNTYAGTDIISNEVHIRVYVDTLIFGPPPCSYSDLLVKAKPDLIQDSNWYGKKLKVYGNYYSNSECYVYVEESHHFIKVLD